MNTPVLFDGATLECGTNKKAFTIVDISSDHRRIWLRRDRAIKIAENADKSIQCYAFIFDENGEEIMAYRDLDERYKHCDTHQIFIIGERKEFVDYTV